MNDIEFKIQRYELYPPDYSNCYVIGFRITDLLNKNNTGYAETTIPISDCANKTSNEICQIAYNKIKPTIDVIINDLINKRNNLTGFIFVPNA